MIDVALITAPSPGPLSALASRRAGTPPLGVAYLAAVLQQEGYRVGVVDMNLCSVTRRYLQRFLEVKRPRVVGISSLTESFPNAIRIAAMVKTLSDEIVVVVGGPHVTFVPQEALRSGPFDFVVCGEGERTLVELTRCLLSDGNPGEQIPGLYWRERSEIRRAPPRPPTLRLDGLPLPARRQLKLDEYPNAGAVMTGRGCPNRCIFCTAGAMFGGRYRRRSPEKVVEEIEVLIGMGHRSLMFLDDTLTADLDRLDRILHLMSKRGIVLSWVCESRVDIEDPGLFRRMSRAGCTGIQFGVESGSPEVLGRLGKGIQLDQVIRSVGAAHRAGINPVCSLIIGLPDDTETTVRQTVDFAVELQREFYAQIGISIATPFPGTYLSRHAEKLGLRIEERDYAQYNLYTPVMRTRHLDRRQIRNLHFEAMDRLRRNAPQGMGNLFPRPPGPEMVVYDDRDDFV
jgi:anaerobic magnesium-protoporphyrin IX monomethyl ester cyclase